MNYDTNNVNGQRTVLNGDVIGRIGNGIKTPLIWFAVGFVTCKILDVYLERSKTKRITA